MSDTRAPRQSLETLATWGTDNLRRIVAVDSQSDSFSETIPSTEGQRQLSELLQGYFQKLGFSSALDASANLVVVLPARDAAEDAPSLAMMAHLDTSFGTQALPHMEQISAWDGGRIDYPGNPHLNVTAERYATTQYFVGDDVLHGPGAAPFGLDDKLGMSEMMTLARVLVENPTIPHCALRLIFRPDEEIGRMAAVEGLADTLKEAGVTHGYTIDGLDPFEINVENFNAARAHVDIPGQRLAPAEGAQERLIGLRIVGVKTHGATARPEGHLNAITVMTRLWDQHLRGRAEIIPVWMKTEKLEETSADVWFQLSADDDDGLSALQGELNGLLQAELAPHGWKGARLTEAHDQPHRHRPRTDALPLALEHLSTFFATPGPAPILPEDSDHYDGYSNPCSIGPIKGDEESGHLRVTYRLRDFEQDNLAARKRHVRQAVARAERELTVDMADQYVNMKPSLAQHPELVHWASAATRAIGREPVLRPIRGGTGVDPFLERRIPVANLGTGYFAPESDKELTSRQNIARHVQWLTHLVQVVARA